MPAVRTHLLGWAPPEGSGAVDVPLAPPPDGSAYAGAPPPAPAPTPPASAPTTPTDPKRADPNWAPRPRNGFIIFRCEFSRAHAKRHDAPRVATGAPAKSLSKRASEAWERLAPEEKKRYQALADAERDEHARQHPNYRFHPVKRTAKSKRRSSRSSETPGKDESAQTRESQPPPLPPPPTPPLPKLDAAVKAARRRSSSVPVVGPYAPGSPFWFSPVTSRPDARRSRSTMARSGVAEYPWDDPVFFPPAPHDATAYMPHLFEDTNAAAPSTLSLPLSEYAYSEPESVPAPTVSPFAAVASSLLGWNGAPSSAPVSRPPSLWDAPCAPSPTDTAQAKHCGTLAAHAGAYPPAGYADADAHPLTELPLGELPWEYTAFAHDALFPSIEGVIESEGGLGAGAGGALELPAAYYQDAATAQALEEYRIGLGDRVGLGERAAGVFEGYAGADAGGAVLQYGM